MLEYSQELFQKRFSLELSAAGEPPKRILFDPAVDTPKLLKIGPDRDFIDAAYRTILGRDPDDAGLAGYLEALRNHTPRRDVIKRMAASVEAKSRIKQAANQEIKIGKPPMMNRLREGVVGKARQVLNQLLLSRFDAIDFRLSFLLNNIAERDQALSTKLEALSEKLNSVAPKDGIMRRFEAILKPGMIVADIGAGSGRFTFQAALSQASAVHSFEPTPELAARLQRDGVIVHQVAVTDKEGTARLAIYRDRPSENALLENRANSIEVRTTSLDAALASAPRLDLIHIDVNGSETLVLRGMGRLMQHNPRLQILLTLNPSADVLGQIKALGLATKRVDDHSGELLETNDTELLGLYSAHLHLSGTSA